MRDGRKHSAVELAVDNCQLCGVRLQTTVIDAPLRTDGRWHYLCPGCADEHAVPTQGTIHRNLPIRRSSILPPLPIKESER